jgi:sigma-54 dependent transcriptional regulator, acetoin dehydrogenase operon transcriptional activator AcoR
MTSSSPNAALAPAHSPASNRLALIAQARQGMLYGGGEQAFHSHVAGLSDSWIARSWQRCLASGLRPEQALPFNLVSGAALQRTRDENHALVRAARPVLEKLGRAIAGSRYFAILTNHQGVVVDVHGDIDRSDRRADLITRVGVDLSERQAGTTAIGAALAELQPVWLHRGEHFFDANSAYSCAGAPLFGPDGVCVGMLDLTGIEATERPELRHLVAQSARSLENALTLAQPHELLLRLNWPGHGLDGDNDGLVCLDADGYLTGANQVARQMVPQLVQGAGGGALRTHSSELFALPFEMLYDHAAASAHRHAPLEVPLWSGLRLQASAQRTGDTALAILPPSAHATPSAHAVTPPPAIGSTPGRALKDIETDLIRKAVDDARGNVLRAAKTLGISRATVYRRLGTGKPGNTPKNKPD